VASVVPASASALFSRDDYATGTHPQSIATGDLNGDGTPDFAVARGNFGPCEQNPGGISILLSDGSGGFAAPTSPEAGGCDPMSIAISDLNDDGKLDLVNGNFDVVDDVVDGNVNVLLGDGSGGFSEAAGSPIDTDGAARHLAVGDVNGDEIPDIAASTGDQFHAYKANVLLGDGTGGFSQAAGSPFSVGGGDPLDLALKDLDGDGVLDLPTLAYAGTASHIAILLGDGSGGFSDASTSPVAITDVPTSMTSDDLNHDGKTDLIVTSRENTGVNGAVTVLLGDGSGGFSATAQSPITVGSVATSAAIADFDGDGNQDLAIANGGSNDVTVLLGDGTGGFSEAAGSPFPVEDDVHSGGYPYSIVAGNFGGDGLVDFATANLTSADVSVFLNDVTPPNTTITSGPSGTTNDPTPTFTFSSSEAGSTFECKVDSASYGSCGSPKTTSPLADGSHTFAVAAVDRAGNPDPTPATRTFTVRTAAVSISGSTLVVTAAAGAKDNLRVTRPSASTVRVSDLASGTYTGSGVHTGAGCTPSGDYTANCSASGVTLIQVASGDQTDQVTNSTALKSSLNGGGANDTLTGGSADDTLTGSTGADALMGMNGNDQLLAHDQTSDTQINCDGGTSPGSADKADLDLLPKDPNSVVVGCETKTRPNPYVALGDSLSVGVGASSPATKGFVGLLYSSYRASLGASELLNEGESGANSTTLRNNGQLTRGLADINNPSDTRAVTIEIGANDGLTTNCRTIEHWAECPFRANFRDILTKLKAALQNDPGTEKLTTMAYYDPPAANSPYGTRAQRERLLLGTNLKIGCTDTAEQAGLDDMIFQEAGKLGIPVADTYPVFQQHGAAYMSPDGFHPNDAGYAAIAQAFKNATVRCGS